MAVIILPDAQAGLPSLQEYMLDKWSETEWLKAGDTFLYAVAGHRQDFATLLMKRLLRI